MPRLNLSHITQNLRRCHWLIAASLLALMLVLGITSMSKDSAIVDEAAHIPAGYSYLHYGDYRLNPEHPPLIKDLAAIPLQFMHLNFPINSPAWTTEVNGQWDAGWAFLYLLGNNADQILFWARLPILLLGVGFGLVLYRYMWRRFGIATGLLTLFFYCLSPNILANARLVTTDLGASIFMFVALMAFIRFVELPNRVNIILLSLGLAAASLSKDSSVLLYPFCLAMAFILVYIKPSSMPLAQKWRTLVGGFIVASLLSEAWIYLFYIPHVWNMPTSVQERLIAGSLPQAPWAINLLTTIAKLPGGKPLAQYLLGVFMVFGRVEGGNVTYLFGTVKNGSFRSYFPLLFLLKTQVAFLILSTVTAGVAIFGLINRKRRPWTAILINFVRSHLVETVLTLFAGFYFAIAVSGNLNLGIRHILPIYVPLFGVMAVATVRLTRRLWGLGRRWRVGAAVVLALLLGWYAESTLAVAPHYLAYFNELIGGPANAGKFFSDSSVDWGQDLRRLQDYLNANPQINRIGLDYFGGGIPSYYFCQHTHVAGQFDCSNSKITPWGWQDGKYPGQYLAVSETYLDNDPYYAAQQGTTAYAYLRGLKPIAEIGYSIYVYKLY